MKDANTAHDWKWSALRRLSFASRCFLFIFLLQTIYEYSGGDK
jgi:hypothetical protein